VARATTETASISLVVRFKQKRVCSYCGIPFSHDRRVVSEGDDVTMLFAFFYGMFLHYFLVNSHAHLVPSGNHLGALVYYASQSHATLTFFLLLGVSTGMERLLLVSE